MSLDAATLALVAGELKNTLLDAKIDKIFEPTRDEVLMTLRTPHRDPPSAAVGPQRLGPRLSDEGELREPAHAAGLLYAAAQAPDRRAAH